MVFCVHSGFASATHCRKGQVSTHHVTLNINQHKSNVS